MRSPTPAVPFFQPTNAFAVLVISAAVAATGCGGAEPPAVKSAGASLTDADSALAELSRAESEIASLLGTAPPAEPAASAAPQTPVAQSAPPPSPPAPSGDAETKPERLASDAPATDACSVACRALASMDRAATHLCGLSGETDPSCSNARERVKNATDRVSARCPCSR